MKRIKLFFLLTLACAFFFVSAKPIKAYIPIGTSEDCRSDKDCIEQYGSGVCESKMCVEPVQSSQKKTVETLERCAQTGELNATCYWIGTNSIVENGSAGQIENVIDGLSIGLNGIPSSLLSSSNGKTLNTGVLPILTNSISFLYFNSPASGVEYLADLGKNFGFVKTTYAQGKIGFRALSPIMGIWKVFRDIAYSFLIVVFLVIGLAIMFRMKIDPKTAITIQNSIPKLVTTLILITFSYAIAGLMIDLMNVASAIAVNAINPSHGIILDTLSGIIDFLGKFFPVLKTAKDAVVNDQSPSVVHLSLLYLIQGNRYAEVITRIINPVTWAFEFSPTTGTVSTITGAISKFINMANLPGKIITLVFSIVLVFSFIKLFLSLLKCYISVLISIIFAPLQLMIGAIPGRDSFGGWFRNLFANLAVFPAVIIMMAITAKIVEAANPGALWVPSPLRLPLIGAPGRIVAAIIAYGLLLLITKVPDMVKDALKAPAFKYGSAIGEAMKPITGPINFATGAVTGGVKSGVGAIISKEMVRPIRGEEKKSSEVGKPPSTGSSDFEAGLGKVLE